MPDVAEPTTITETKPSFMQLMKDAAKADPENPANKGNAAQPTPPAQPKPEPAKETPKPDEHQQRDADIESGKVNPRREDFKRIKGFAEVAGKERDELKSKYSTLEKEIAELRKAPKANADEIAALLKERDSLKSVNDALTLDIQPEFRAKYDGQIQNELNSLKGVIPDTELGAIQDILQMREGPAKNKAIAEATENLNAYQIGQIAAVNKEMSKIRQQETAELGKAREALKTIGEERQAKAKAFAEQQSKAVNMFVDKLKSDHPMFKQREGDAEWNNGVEERLAILNSAAKGEIQGEDFLDLAARGATAHVWAAENKALREENAALKSTLEKLQGSSPNLGGGGQGGDKSGKNPDFFQMMREASKKPNQ